MHLISDYSDDEWWYEVIYSTTMHHMNNDIEGYIIVQ